MADKIEVQLEFDPIFGARAKQKVVAESEDIGDKAGSKFSEGFKDKVNRNSKTLLSGVNIAIAGIAAAVGAAFASKQFIDAATKQQDAVNKLGQSLKSAGSFSQEALKDFQSFASGLQSTTTIGDELTLELASLARNFTKTNDEAKRLTQAAIELSAATGLSLEGSVKNLGKSFGGLTGELGESIPQIKNFTKEQLQAGAAIDLVLKRFGGSAAAQAQTFTGSLAQLSNKFGDLKELIGNIIITSPALVKLFNIISKAITDTSERITKLSENRDILGDLLNAFISFGQSFLKFVVRPLEFVFNSVKLIFSATEVLLQAFVGTLGGLLGAIAGPLESLGIISKETETSLKTFAESSKEVFGQTLDGATQAFDGLFNRDFTDQGILLAENLRLALQPTKDAMKEEINGATTEAEKGADSFIDRLIKFRIDISKQLNQGFGNIVASSIQKLAQNLADGKSLFDDFGNFVLGLIGDLAIQIGTFIVATAIAKSALFGPVELGVAEGAALIVTGVLIKSLAGGGGSAPTGSALSSGGGGGIGSSIEESEAVTETPDQTSVSVVIQGDVLDSEDSGLRIAQILNNAFDKQGVVIKGAVA